MITLKGLINRLKKLEKEVGPGAIVTVHLEELRFVTKTHDDLSHYAIGEVEGERILWRGANDDTWNEDGSEKTRAVVTLKI